MKYLFLLLTFLYIGQSLQAQRQITGEITDTDEHPIPYAMVSVSQKDTSKRYLTSKIADSLGKFTLLVEQKGQLFLRVSAVGYQTKEQAVTDNKGNQIMLERNDHQLSDVAVNAKKPLVERKVDRIVMNVDNNPLAAGKSSMEAIALAPGILIRDGQIMINGLTGSRVMVNGKLLQLTGNDLTNYLTSLRTDDIKSIEIIAHPPAEYDAAGTGGLINIILKKQTDLGLYGSVYGNYSQGRLPETSEGVQLNFKKGKLGLFGSYSYEWEKGFDNLNQTRTFPGDGTYMANNIGTSKEKGQRVHIGGTYDLTDNQYLALDYTGSFSDSKEQFSAFSRIEYPDAPDNNSHSKGVFPNTYESKYHDIGLNYHINTDTLGSQFVFLSDYTINNSNSTNDARSEFYNAGNQHIGDSSFRNATPAKAKIFTADAKYKQVIKNVGTLSFGSKINSTNIHNEAAFKTMQEGKWTDDPNQNFIYDYKENILAGYVNFSGDFLGMKLQAGLRGENTRVKGTLYDTAGVNKNPSNYFGLFPSIYLSKPLNKEGDNSLSISYNRRLNRPGFSSLNPHISYVDNYTSGRGNPYLTPEYNNAVELNYTLHNKYIFSATYTKNSDVINNAIFPEAGDAEKMTQQPINSGSTEIWMLMAFVPVKITKWWTTQNTLQLSNQHAKAEAFDLQKNIGMLQSSQVFTVGGGVTISASAYYLTNVIFANAIIDHIFNTDIAVQKKFFDDKLTLKVAGNDVFGTSKVYGNFYYNDFNLNFDQIRQTQKITVGLTYNFNLGKAFKAKTIQSSNAEEKNRL